MNPIVARLLNIIANQTLALVSKDQEIADLKEELDLVKCDAVHFEDLTKEMRSTSDNGS